MLPHNKYVQSSRYKQYTEIKKKKIILYKRSQGYHATILLFTYENFPLLIIYSSERYTVPLNIHKFVISTKKF